MWNHIYAELHAEVATDNVEDVEQMSGLAKEIPDGEEVAGGRTRAKPRQVRYQAAPPPRMRNNTSQAPPFNRSNDQLGMLSFQHILDQINGLENELMMPRKACMLMFQIFTES